MSNKVFGIGWAKTGTTTLGRCLKILGYEHQGQRLDLVDDVEQGDLSRIEELARAKQSFDDWPWISLYQQLDQIFPGSKFILTVREPVDWLRSYRNMLQRQKHPTPELNKIRQVLYGLPFPNVSDQQLLDRFIAHNKQVLNYFENRPDALLVVNWFGGDRWPQICSFLGKEIPKQAFPHENKGRYLAKQGAENN